MYSFCLDWFVEMDSYGHWLLSNIHGESTLLDSPFTLCPLARCCRKCETTASRATPSPTTPCWTPARNAAAWRKRACCWKICVRRVLTLTSSPIPPSSRAIAWQETRVAEISLISQPLRDSKEVICQFETAKIKPHHSNPHLTPFQQGLKHHFAQYSSHYWMVLMCMFTLHCIIEGASALVPPTPFYGGGQGDKLPSLRAIFRSGSMNSPSLACSVPLGELWRRRAGSELWWLSMTGWNRAAPVKVGDESGSAQCFPVGCKIFHYGISRFMISRYWYFFIVVWDDEAYQAAIHGSRPPFAVEP